MSTAPTTFLPTASLSDNTPTTGPAAACSAGPASNNQATTTSPVTRRNISTVAGPAAHVPLPRLSIATLPVARATASEKGKARDLPGDGLETPPFYKRQRIGLRVGELIKILSDEEGDRPRVSIVALSAKRGELPGIGSSRFGSRSLVHSHNGNAGHNSVRQGGPSHIIFDCSGKRVTSEVLLVILGPLPYIDMEYVLDAYHWAYGSRLMPEGAKPQKFIRALAGLEGLELWVPKLKGPDFPSLASINILRRADLDLGAIRQVFLKKLGLTENPAAPVLGPRLCYAISRNLESSLAMVTRCNNVYQYKCPKHEDGYRIDNNCRIAVSVLRDNRFNSQLLLGNKSYELREFYKNLVHVADKSATPRIKNHLQQISKALWNQPQ
ncbi:hypothetical protein GGH94_005971 [Coemansia aciculifera]|uniref:Uncharacterized protein n=1 Tax=Coemansia aciculifera TaxID=417176 RepID=A0A9W8IHF7_9FUNG|nr:hypothetical protein GGH94_005971 [Coemansia aciculifera]KAJ2869976.1 hypothetical protein GGH93_005921 [Coemansia aciculifera]